MDRRIGAGGVHGWKRVKTSESPESPVDADQAWPRPPHQATPDECPRQSRGLRRRGRPRHAGELESVFARSSGGSVPDTRHQRPTPAGAGAAARTPSRTTHRRSDRHTLPDRVPRSGVAMWSSRLHGSHAPAGPTPGQGPLPRPGTASTPLKEPCRSMLRRRSPERGGSDSYTTSRDATAVRGRCGSRAV